MYKVLSSAISLWLLLTAQASYADAGRQINDASVTAFNERMEAAVHARDYATLEAAFLADADIQLDMSASNSDEPTTMSVPEYMALTRMGLAMATDLKFTVQRLQLEISDDGQSAELVEKNDSEMLMMDIKVTSTELVYSKLRLVDGEIRIAAIRSKVITDNMDQFEEELLERLEQKSLEQQTI